MACVVFQASDYKIVNAGSSESRTLRLLISGTFQDIHGPLSFLLGVHYFA
jgi:hypothetical protein